MKDLPKFTCVSIIVLMILFCDYVFISINVNIYAKILFVFISNGYGSISVYDFIKQN